METIGKEKITKRQLAILVSLFIIGSSIIILPSALARTAKQDAWITAGVAPFFALLFLFIYTRLSKRMGQQSLVQYAERVMGIWVGKVISLLFFSFFFILSSAVLRNLGDFLKTQILIETPLEATHILFIIVTLFGISLGIEPIARTAEMLFPPVIGLVLFSVLLISPQIKMDQITPILENGIGPVVRSIITYMGTPYLELVVFLLILPHVSPSTDLKKPLWIGLAIGGGVLFATTLLTLMVLGPELTAMNTYPTYALAKKINVGNFLQRIEAIMAGIWVTSIFLKSILALYAATITLTHIFSIQDHKVLLIPLGMFVVLTSIIIFPNYPYFLMFVGEIWPFYAITVGLFLPVLLLAVGKVRGV